MSAMTRTIDTIWTEIQALREADHAADAEPDSAAYWSAAAGRAERQRDLWRELGNHCGGDVPEWSRLAASRTGDLYADLGARYRVFAGQTA